MGLYAISNLREVRELKYPKMKDFLEKCDLTRTTIERAESGKKKISGESMKIIAQVLGFDENDLVDVERTHMDRNFTNNKTWYFKVSINDNADKYKIGENIKTRYMGRSSIDIAMREYFFTTDMKKPINKCNFDISIKIPSDYNIEILANRLWSLKFEEEVILNLVDSHHMKIVDFQSKTRLINYKEEAIQLIDYMIDHIEHYDKISLRDNIIISGDAIIDTIVILSLRQGGEIGEYIKDNINEFFRIRHWLNCATGVLISNISYSLCEKEALEHVNILYKNMVSKKKLFRELYDLYKENEMSLVDGLILNLRRESNEEIYSRKC